MEYTQDADGYVIPPTPTRSSGAPSNISVSSAGSSRKKLVEDPSYRQVNLGLNNIYLRPPTEPVPEHVAQLLAGIRRDNESSGPSLDQVRQDADLQALEMSTNQCLGGSASCINISERLNRRVGEYNIEGLNTTVFSIAMSGSEARLFVSWKQDNVSYYTQKVDSFALQRAEHYLEFRNYVLNIIDWGLKTRLERIQTLLDQLFEEDRKALSQMAKSRQPPSDDTSNEEGSKKRRDSSSSARRGRSKRVQEPGPAE
ncbi:hypothetical protein CJF30_00006856 [Rutstroemia sp. NJR-2017a BBW]|nr:hypothetical protein CJF30_00006856 [Rutstroemia sp. NJR-2017a BBW]